jgi:hypothetical protein
MSKSFQMVAMLEALRNQVFQSTLRHIGVYPTLAMFCFQGCSLLLTWYCIP